jgi:hypothetical protein
MPDLTDKIPELSDKTKDVFKVALIIAIFVCGIAFLIHDYPGSESIDKEPEENRRASMKIKIPFQGMAEFNIRFGDEIVENRSVSKDNIFEGDSYFITNKTYSSGQVISIEETTSRGYYMVIENIVIPRILSGDPAYFHYYLSENRFYVPGGEDFRYCSGDGGTKVVIRDPLGSEPIPYMLGLRILEKYNAEGILPAERTENTIVFEIKGGKIDRIEAVKENGEWTLPKVAELEKP